MIDTPTTTADITADVGYFVSQNLSVDFAVGTLEASSERAMNLWRSVIDRVQTCIADHNAGEFLSA